MDQLQNEGMWGPTLLSNLQTCCFMAVFCICLIFPPHKTRWHSLAGEFPLYFLHREERDLVFLLCTALCHLIKGTKILALKVSIYLLAVSRVPWHLFFSWNLNLFTFHFYFSLFSASFFHSPFLFQMSFTLFLAHLPSQMTHLLCREVWRSCLSRSQLSVFPRLFILMTSINSNRQTNRVNQGSISHLCKRFWWA